MTKDQNTDLNNVFGIRPRRCDVYQYNGFVIFAVTLDDRAESHNTRLHLSENRQGLARCDCSMNCFVFLVVTCLVCRFPGASHVQSDLHAHRRLGGGGRGVDCISTGTWNIEIHLV